MSKPYSLKRDIDISDLSPSSTSQNENSLGVISPSSSLHSNKTLTPTSPTTTHPLLPSISSSLETEPIIHDNPYHVDTSFSATLSYASPFLFQATHTWQNKKEMQEKIKNKNKNKRPRLLSKVSGKLPSTREKWQSSSILPSWLTSSYTTIPFSYQSPQNPFQTHSESTFTFNNPSRLNGYHTVPYEPGLPYLSPHASSSFTTNPRVASPYYNYPTSKLMTMATTTTTTATATATETETETETIKKINTTHPTYTVPTTTHVPSKTPTSLFSHKQVPHFVEDETHSQRSVLWHLEFPTLIMGYIQLIWSLLLLGTFSYFLYLLYWAIKMDLTMKVHDHSASIALEIAQCAKEYSDNQCEINTRVPAMHLSCSEWEACMQRDPARIAWTKVSAMALAEILDQFVDKLSIKSMGFFALLFASFLLLNMTHPFHRKKRPKETDSEKKYQIPNTELFVPTITPNGSVYYQLVPASNT